MIQSHISEIFFKWSSGACEPLVGLTSVEAVPADWGASPTSTSVAPSEAGCSPAGVGQILKCSVKKLSYLLPPAAPAAEFALQRTLLGQLIQKPLYRAATWNIVSSRP